MISRRAVLGLAGAGALLAGGCSSKPLRPPNPDGTYCFAVGRWYRRERTCTDAPIPSPAQEAEAKRFEPSPGALTLYVVRKRWGDVINRVDVDTGSGLHFVTVPESFARVRLAPGTHKLKATWSEGTTSLEIAGAAGEVQFVELVGSVWSWGSTYRLERGDPEDGRSRANGLRLIVDAR